MKKMNNAGFSLIELIIVIAIMAVLVAVIAPNLTSYLGNSKKKTDNSNADTIESVINAQLQTLTSDDTISATNTVTGYKTVDGIITATANAWNGNGILVATSETKAPSSTPGENTFEGLVKKNIPDKYMNDDKTTLKTKQKDFKFWVKIEGNDTDGYTAQVKCAKSDPFDGRDGGSETTAK